jgi:hypothetical protein
MCVLKYKKFSIRQNARHEIYYNSETVIIVLTLVCRSKFGRLTDEETGVMYSRQKNCVSMEMLKETEFNIVNMTEICMF